MQIIPKVQGFIQVTIEWGLQVDQVLLLGARFLVHNQGRSGETDIRVNLAVGEGDIDCRNGVVN